MLVLIVFYSKFLQIEFIEKYKWERRMSLKIEDLNIILLARDSTAQKHYKEFFAIEGVRYFNISSEAQLENILEIIPINGIVADIRTTLRATGTEKLLYTKLEDIYPFIRVRWDEEREKINTIYPDDSVENLHDFLSKICVKSDPRVLRTSNRAPLSVNVIASENDQFSGYTEKSCTLNVSESGLFIITSSPFWKENQRIYVVINEISSRTPIICTIVRKIFWGEEALCTPGISIRFDSILDSQQDELFKLAPR